MSPIITTQRRHAEQGRIRLGQKVSTQSGKQRPDKLDRFRFTSPNRGLIEQVAAKYGGTARTWDNDGKAEWEVISDARQIPVIVVKGGFSQWHEFWTKAGCKHRCDGEKDAAGVFCNPDDPEHLQAIEKPTTRLSVMLEEIGGLGVWRMETKGWNAAAELPNMAELAMHVADLVPATLYLAERSSVIQTPKGPQTSRYVVPGLDLNVTKAQLIEIMGHQGGAAQIAGGASSPTQIGGPSPMQIEAGPAPDYSDDIADVANLEELKVLWNQIGTAGHLTDDVKAALTARAADFPAPAPQTPEAGASTPPASGPAEDAQAELFALQQQILAGAKGMTSDQVLADLEQTFAQPVDDLTAEQLRQYLEGAAA